MIDVTRPPRRSEKSNQVRTPFSQTPVWSQATQTPENTSGFPPGEDYTEPPIDLSAEPLDPKKPHWHRFKNLSKRKRILMLLAVGVLLVAGTAAGLMIFKSDGPSPAPVALPQESAEEPKPTTEASRLTGVQISPELNKLPVTGVMIENSLDARPQSGLGDAGVVVEAIAEGGITRFLALYLEGKPKSVGPVRSVRPYYLDFLVPFDGAIAHAGGSAQALDQIRKQEVKDLDQFFNPAAYRRVSSRIAPHNLYTSREQLLKLHDNKNFKTSTFTSWLRKEEAPAETPTASTITFTISGPPYNTSYTYDKKTNSYKRTLGGRAHIDAASKKRLSPKVVIALVTTHKYAGKYSIYKLTGSGDILVYQDGGVTRGTWSKDSRKKQFVFTGSDNKPLALNPGQTWITLIESGGVRHKP